MDDLLSGDDIDEMMSELSDDPTTVAPLRIPLSEKTRPSLKTPILSGKQMAGQKRPPIPPREAVGTQRLFAASRDEEAETATVEIKDIPGDAAQKLSVLPVDEIYERAGLDTTDSEAFTVYRVESMLDDESIAELDEQAREAAVVMALKTHNVPMAAVVEDAKDRALALDEHDARLKDQLATIEDKIKTENERLHAEIERYANPRIERMEKNEARLEQMRREYRDWYMQKDGEQGNLERMIKRWSDESLQIDTVRLAAEIDAARTAITSPTPAVVSPQTVQNIAPTPVAPPPLLYEDDRDLVKPEFIFDDMSVEMVGAEPLLGFDETQQSSISSELPDLHSPGLRFPRTILQWLVTLLALGMWVISAILMGTIATTLTPPAALGIPFAIPPFLAFLLSFLSRGRGFAMGFVAWLLYSSIAMFLFVHLSAPRFVEQATQEKYWIVNESPWMPAQIGDPLSMGIKMYGEQLIATGLVDAPAPKSDKAPDSTKKDGAKKPAKDAPPKN